MTPQIRGAVEAGPVSGVSYVASEIIAWMASLGAFEECICDQYPHVRRTARRDQSAAVVVVELWPFWERELSAIFDKSQLAKATC